MYLNITNENAYKTPMRIYPAVHYTMGGLWADYNLMSNIPGYMSWGKRAGRWLLRNSQHNCKLSGDPNGQEGFD
jgi:succinate dehydrogenase/fumarate reductase flavoprotein subunit